MGKILNKLIVCFFVFCIVLSLYQSKSYGDQREYNHIHVRGRITTSNGQAVEGADLIITQSGSGSAYDLTATRLDFLTGVPNDPAISTTIVGGPNTVKTGSNGEYHFIVRFSGPLFDIDQVSVDKTKMKWEKAGYLIRPR